MKITAEQIDEVLNNADIDCERNKDRVQMIVTAVRNSKEIAGFSEVGLSVDKKTIYVLIGAGIDIGLRLADDASTDTN